MRQPNKSWWLLVAAILLLPLVSMVIVPFYDTSEPRYAEIARIMAETGDWVTPWFSPGVPFWGKPPLSFWAQALSMKAFGYTEFAARFPSWLCLVFTVGLMFTGIRSIMGARLASWAALIYSTCTLVYISSGAVLTDPFLALGTTLSLISFARVAQGDPIKGGARLWSYGFFIGLAIGLLAKGPLALLVIGAPILVWGVGRRMNGHNNAVRMPWLSGLILTSLLSVPWYIAAELKTPGFLDYFIVGEHFRRFLDPGWAGDLYGSAHKRVYGTIWLYWLQASFPWGVLALATLGGALRSPRLRQAVAAVYRDPTSGYWVAGVLFTPVFFTFSANVLWTYVLPSLAGFSVLSARLMVEVLDRFRIVPARFLPAATLVPAVVLVGSAIMWTKPDLRNTERELIRYAMEQPASSLPVFYLDELPFSAQFYSAGQARAVGEPELGRLVKSGLPFYLAIPKSRSTAIMGRLNTPVRPVFSNKRYDLVRVA